MAPDSMVGAPTPSRGLAWPAAAPDMRVWPAQTRIRRIRSPAEGTRQQLERFTLGRSVRSTQRPVTVGSDFQQISPHIWTAKISYSHFSSSSRGPGRCSNLVENMLHNFLRVHRKNCWKLAPFEKSQQCGPISWRWELRPLPFNAGRTTDF